MMIKEKNNKKKKISQGKEEIRNEKKYRTACINILLCPFCLLVTSQ